MTCDQFQSMANDVSDESEDEFVDHISSCKNCETWFKARIIKRIRKLLQDPAAIIDCQHFQYIWNSGEVFDLNESELQVLVNHVNACDECRQEAAAQSPGTEVELGEFGRFRINNANLS